MINKLFRIYNQNRRAIWTIIISITFFLILLYTIFGILRDSRYREQQEMLEQYYNSKNVIKDDNNSKDYDKNVNIDNSNNTQNKITSNSSSIEVINYFTQLCNDKKIEEAYNMISEDCKNTLFPQMKDFKNNYYDKIFMQDRSVKVEKSIYGGNIYKVTYTNNILANGKYDPATTKQDYIYTTKENDEMKVSLNKFLYSRKINRTEENNGITIKILRKKVYVEYEKYEIQISNSAQETIYIMPNEEKIYLLDKNEVKYKSDVDELQKGVTIIESGKSISFKLTFNKIYRFKQRF